MPAADFQTQVAQAEKKMADIRDAFVAEGRSIIAKGAENISRLSEHYGPAFKAAALHLENTLNSLFHHAMTTPAEFAQRQADLAAKAETAALNEAEAAKAADVTQ